MNPQHASSKSIEEAIIRTIYKYPGLSLRELSREMETSPQLIKYHVDHLIKECIISVKPDGKFQRYFHQTLDIAEYEEKIIASLRKPQLLRTILIFIQALEKERKAVIKNNELLEQLNITSASTVTYYTSQLIQADILIRLEPNSGFMLKNPLLIKRMVKKYKPTNSILENFTSLWLDFFS